MINAVLLSGRNRVFPYRCDTPNLRRKFTMSVKVLEAQTVLLLHELVNVEQMHCGVRFKYKSTPKNTSRAAACAMPFRWLTAGWIRSTLVRIRRFR